MISCYTHRHSKRPFRIRIIRLIRNVDDLTRLAEALRRLLWQLLGTAVLAKVIIVVLTGRATTVCSEQLLGRLSG